MGFEWLELLEAFMGLVVDKLYPFLDGTRRGSFMVPDSTRYIPSQVSLVKAVHVKPTSV